MVKKVSIIFILSLLFLSCDFKGVIKSIVSEHNDIRELEELISLEFNSDCIIYSTKTGDTRYLQVYISSPKDEVTVGYMKTEIAAILSKKPNIEYQWLSIIFGDPLLELE